MGDMRRRRCLLLLVVWMALLGTCSGIEIDLDDEYAKGWGTPDTSLAVKFRRFARSQLAAIQDKEGEEEAGDVDLMGKLKAVIGGPRGKQGSSGPPGAQGPKGVTGPPGTAGDQGSVGLQGKVGPIGLTGPEGGPGSEGAFGPGGPQGKVGSSGEKGRQGPRGLRGDAGVVGSMLGPAGKRGSSGYQGPPGNKGSIGQKGMHGEQGTRGSTSCVGPPGIAGEKGLVGKPGIRGHEGPQGIRGKRGIEGPRGDTGESGVRGVKGVHGSEGEAGPLGPQGEVGLKGEKGSRGPSGPLGSQGNVGVVGDKGAQGLPGAVGIRGNVGKHGFPGERGAEGLQGQIGTIGPDGQSGPKGPVGHIGKAGRDGEIGPKGDEYQYEISGPKGFTMGLGGDKGTIYSGMEGMSLEHVKHPCQIRFVQKQQAAGKTNVPAIIAGYHGNLGVGTVEPEKELHVMDKCDKPDAECANNKGQMLLSASWRNVVISKVKSTYYDMIGAYKNWANSDGNGVAAVYVGAHDRDARPTTTSCERVYFGGVVGGAPPVTRFEKIDGKFYASKFETTVSGKDASDILYDADAFLDTAHTAASVDLSHAHVALHAKITEHKSQLANIQTQVDSMLATARRLKSRMQLNRDVQGL